MKLNFNVHFLTSLVFTFALSASVMTIAPSFAVQDEVLYGDCGYLQFEDVDNELLTKEEQLELLDKDFESALNRSEKCLKTAVENSNEALAKTGGGAGSSGGGTDDLSSISSVESEQALETTRETNSTTESQTSDTHPRGEQTSGASAVCDAVNQGLKSASTPSEREHFEKLAKQYQC